MHSPETDAPIAPPTPEGRPASVLFLHLLEALLRAAGPRDFAVSLWDGSVLPAEAGHGARFTVAIRDPSVIRLLAQRCSVAALVEARALGQLDVRGDLRAARAVARRLAAAPPTVLGGMLRAAVRREAA